MTESSNRRGKHRRYADRRIAALLQVHEVLFHDACDPNCANRLLQVLQDDFEVDRAAFLRPSEGPDNGLQVPFRSGDWGDAPLAAQMTGDGIDALIRIHRQASGALTLSRFRQPSVFEASAWDALWTKNMLHPASALLSVSIDAPGDRGGFLFLILNGTSREWSSHDRDLAEETAAILAVATSRSRLF